MSMTKKMIFTFAVLVGASSTQQMFGSETVKRVIGIGAVLVVAYGIYKYWYVPCQEDKKQSTQSATTSKPVNTLTAAIQAEQSQEAQPASE